MVRDMSISTIRPSYDMWPQYNRRLREVIGAMSAEQLAIGAARTTLALTARQWDEPSAGYPAPRWMKATRRSR